MKVACEDKEPENEKEPKKLEQITRVSMKSTRATQSEAERSQFESVSLESLSQKSKA